MNRGKLRNLNAQLEQQIVNFLSLKIFNKIGPSYKSPDHRFSLRFNFGML